MATFTKELHYLSAYFKQVKKSEHILFRWLYLSPEARIERLRELMMPVSAPKNECAQSLQAGYAPRNPAKT